MHGGIVTSWLNWELYLRSHCCVGAVGCDGVGLGVVGRGRALGVEIVGVLGGLEAEAGPGRRIGLLLMSGDVAR